MIAIKQGKVFSQEKKAFIDNNLILIEGNYIKAAGENVEFAENVKVIDASSCYIMPGFIDAHTHIGLEEEIYRIEGDDVNEISDPITPHLRAVDGINWNDLAFTDALKGGVTRSVSMPGSANIIGGQAVFIKHLASSIMDMVCKNPCALKAALGENPKRVYTAEKKSPKTRMANAAFLREAFYKAAKKLDKSDLSPEEEFKFLPLFKVLRKEMPLFLHAHRADDILTALRIKDEFGFELVIQHGTEAFMVADELVRRDVPVFLGPLLVNRAKVEMKEVAFKNAALLDKAGVKFAFITDHPVVPIEQLRVCAALAVREGLSEERALEALTAIPAQILKCDGDLGSIAPGKRADIVIFDGHPLEFKSRVKYVMVDGVLWGDNLE
ncbi:amidohydrolase [Thermosyntropha sp.]|uniref:amidohydrolase n=1 Tax=Thermosyntropha sp. TaxID=2740820 RepID=UPI0025E86208|nr:amidohydrolase [Thermosyntropha sp.]MBO8158251.1 amidohydrolase [Thermosyntropha sp.]